jgi:NADP-dependent 3-hydroxy acid dehydrogenase YdfG
VVLVTGASHGLGQATAALLAEHGYQVFGTARQPTADNVRGIQMLPLDVTSQESVTSRVAKVLDRSGQIDVLVKNAAAALIGAIEETPVEDAMTLFDTNLFGTARMINAVLPHMRQRRSRLIINLGSLAPAVPTPFHAYLSASKAAVNTFTDVLRLTVRHLGIAVTTLQPGAIATHPGEQFTKLRVAAAIGDYTQQEARATAVYQHGQSRLAPARKPPPRPSCASSAPWHQPATTWPGGRSGTHGAAGSCRHRRWSRSRHATSR